MQFIEAWGSRRLGDIACGSKHDWNKQRICRIFIAIINRWKQFLSLRLSYAYWFVVEQMIFFLFNIWFSNPLSDTRGVLFPSWFVFILQAIRLQHSFIYMYVKLGMLALGCFDLITSFKIYKDDLNSIQNTLSLCTLGILEDIFNYLFLNKNVCWEW